MARRAIQAPSASVFVSAASVWEIAIKQSIGRLRVAGGRTKAIDTTISACAFVELPVTALHASGVRDLPHHHGDPFDRLLVAQAKIEGLQVVTADERFAPYRVQLVPADE